MNTPIKQEFFNNIAAEFDTHVRQSIPLFDEFIRNLQHSIANVLPVKSILDICGSTGKFGYDLILRKGYRGAYTNVDGSPEMIKISEGLRQSLPKERQAYYIPVLGGYKASWVDDSGIEIPEFEITYPYDMVLEILGFQFFTKDREVYIKELASRHKYCVFFEKFTTRDKDLWQENERLKDALHKSKFFSEEELEKKRRDVLDDMGEYLVDIDDFKEMLGSYFTSVNHCFHAGNFHGFLCSMDEDANMPYFDGKLTNNIYNP